MLDLWVRTPEENKNYNQPKWQNKTPRKVIKAEKTPAAVQRRYICKFRIQFFLLKSGIYLVQMIHRKRV
jgi:hypothetical protein